LGWGGSGGKINIIANNADEAIENAFMISVNGGKNLTINEEFCSNGATGTLCITQLGRKRLYVNGSFSYTQSPTILSPYQLNAIDDIYIINNALSSFHIYNLNEKSSIVYQGKNLHIENSDFEDFVHSADKVFFNVSFNMINISNS
jgi:hypothetical protein